MLGCCDIWGGYGFFLGVGGSVGLWGNGFGFLKHSGEVGGVFEAQFVGDLPDGFIGVAEAPLCFQYEAVPDDLGRGGIIFGIQSLGQ